MNAIRFKSSFTQTTLQHFTTMCMLDTTCTAGFLFLMKYSDRRFSNYYPPKLDIDFYCIYEPGMFYFNKTNVTQWLV